MESLKIWFNKYRELGFIVFNVGIKWSNEEKRKIYFPPLKYQNFTLDDVKYEGIKTITKDDKTFTVQQTSIGLLMGQEYKKNRFLILIDIDNKEKDGVLNGMKLLKNWKSKCDINTVQEQTGSKGEHYFFYVNEDEKKYLKNAQTTLIVDGKRYAVDYKFTHQYSTIAPSFYFKNGEKLSYLWLDKQHSLGEKEIQHIPEVIFNDIKNESIVSVDTKTVKHVITKVDKEIILENDVKFTEKSKIEDIEMCLKYINHYEDFQRWTAVGFICKNLNINSFDVFNKWAKKSDKYEENENIKMWNNHKARSNITINHLIHFVKEDEEEGYEEVIKHFKDKLDEMLENDMKPIFKTIKINKMYLHEKGKKFVENADDKFDRVITKIMNMTHKQIIAVDSACGTGKTEMIKSILDSFPEKTKSVLYITYRQTLADDKFGSFKQYGFNNYLEKKINYERQIISLDSITKIEKKYDVIILDEIESLLFHLTGKTITKKKFNNVEIVFNRFYEICKESKYIFALDGNYSNRSHIFLSSFNRMITVIENTFSWKDKKFCEFNTTKAFNDKLIEKLEENKKCVIVCMSAKKCCETEEWIKQKYPKKNIKMYYKNSDDVKKRKDLKDCTTAWNDCDVLIYSPTIEAGVDYNNLHFDNLFIMYSPYSTSYRGLYQMINRVRHFKDGNVYVIFKHCPKNKCYYTLDDIKMNYSNITDIKDFTALDYIFIYNSYETTLSNHDFYHIFKNLMTKKGNTWEDMKDEKDMCYKKKNIIIDKLKNVRDYTDDDITYIFEMMKNNVASEEEKYAVERFLYKKKFGLDEIDDDFLKYFLNRRYIFDNYLALVDERNIKNIDLLTQKFHEYEMLKNIECIRIVKQIINVLGWKNVFDTIRQRKDDLEKIFKSKPLHDLLYKYVGTKMGKKKLFNTFTFRAMLGYVNKLFNEFGINLHEQKERKRVDGERKYFLFYVIEPYHKIDCYVQKRIMKDNKFKLFDENKHFKFAFDDNLFE